MTQTRGRHAQPTGAGSAKGGRAGGAGATAGRVAPTPTGVLQLQRVGGNAAVARAVAQGAVPPRPRAPARSKPNGSSPAGLVIQRLGEVYGALSAPKKATVDEIAKQRYRQEAALFEVNLGKALGTDARAVAGADAILTRIRGMIDAYTTATGEALDKQIVATFGTPAKEMLGTMGAVKASASTLEKTLLRGNLREKMTMLYFALRNGEFAKMLDKAYEDNLAGLNAAAWGTKLDTVELTKAQAGLTDDKGQKQLRNYLSRTDLVTRQERGILPDKERAKALPKELKTPSQMGAAGGDLSYWEMKAAFPEKAQKLKTSKVKAVGAQGWKQLTGDQRKAMLHAQVKDTKLQWAPGYLNYKILPALQQKADALNVVLLGGLSGSTDMYMHAAKYVKLSVPELQKLRLASLGSMLPARDHSFYEIMIVAKEYGLADYQPGPAGYKTIAPLPASEIRAMGARGAFPGDFLSPQAKDAIAAKKFSTKEKGATLDADPGATSLALMLDSPTPKSDRLKDLLKGLGLVEDELALKKRDPDGFDPTTLLALTDRLIKVCDAFLKKETGAFKGGKTEKPLVESVRAALMRHRLESMGATPVLTAGIGPKAIPSFYALVEKMTAGTLFQGAATDDKKKAAFKTLKGGAEVKALRTNLGSMADAIAAWLVTQYYPQDLGALTPDEAKEAKLAEDVMGSVQQNISGRTILGSATNRPDENTRYKTAGLDTKGTRQNVENFFRLTPEQLDGILAYTGAQYKAFNDSDIQTDSIKKYRKDAAAGLRALPSYQGPLFRGDYGGKNAAVGQTFNISSFYSTAKTPEGSFIPARPTAWVITEHKSAKDIEGLSQKPWEAEALMPPPLRFKITRIVDERAPKGSARRGVLDTNTGKLTGPGGTANVPGVSFDPRNLGPNKDAWKTWYTEGFSNKKWIELKEV